MFSRYCSCYPLALPTIWCNLQYCYVVRVQGSIKKICPQRKPRSPYCINGRVFVFRRLNIMGGMKCRGLHEFLWGDEMRIKRNCATPVSVHSTLVLSLMALDIRKVGNTFQMIKKPRGTTVSVSGREGFPIT